MAKISVRICDFHGQTVATSRNLRGVLTFARKHPVDVVRIWPGRIGGVRVAFYFDRRRAGGAFNCETSWIDGRVALHWLVTRRSWSVERLALDRELWEKFSELPAIATLRDRGTIVHPFGYEEMGYE